MTVQASLSRRRLDQWIELILGRESGAPPNIAEGSKVSGLKPN
jgi:hypothetical protein